MTYPALFLRIKAMLIDNIILGVLLFTLTIISGELGISGVVIKVAFIILPVILFEPLLIWTTGGSIGHHLSGIRVIGQTSGKNLFILNGIVRYVVKLACGVFILASLFITKRHQSIHDVLSHSVVVLKNAEAAPARHQLQPRETTYTSEKPSIIRRLVVIVAYSSIAWFVYGVIVFFTVTGDCAVYRRCTETETLTSIAAGIIFLLSLLLIFVLGFLCKLPGAYFQRNSPVEEKP